MQNLWANLCMPNETFANEQGKIRIGVINLMPDVIPYQQELISSLSAVQSGVELVWIKLKSKTYSDTYASDVAQQYQYFDEAYRDGGIDALLLTGAPVELLDFEEVRYWEELKALLLKSMSMKLHIMGICWGALALAKLHGINKINLDNKRFGLYAMSEVFAESKVTEKKPVTTFFPLSVRAWFDEKELSVQLADGRVLPMVRCDEFSFPIIQSADTKCVMCLPHPEYGPKRLIEECIRDRLPGNTEPLHIRGLNVENPSHIWRADADKFFIAWVKSICGSRQPSQLINSRNQQPA